MAKLAQTIIISAFGAGAIAVPIAAAVNNADYFVSRNLPDVVKSEALSAAFVAPTPEPIAPVVQEESAPEVEPAASEPAPESPRPVVKQAVKHKAPAAQPAKSAKEESKELELGSLDVERGILGVGHYAGAPKVRAAAESRSAKRPEEAKLVFEAR